jgi:hypothetical protein
LGRLNKLLLLITVQLVLFVNVAFAQYSIFNNLPQEKITLKSNSNLFVAGESLYYNLNCFNKETSSLSNMSKMAYVLLVDDDKKIIFKHKLKLHQGIASGDFFIPSNLSTGNYKLIAYTKWMLYQHKTPFDLIDIYIINPYSRTIKTSKRSNKEVDTIFAVKDINTTPKKSDLLHLLIDKKTYGQRDKVKLEIQNIVKGNFSISVRKLDSIDIKHSQTTQSFGYKESNGTSYIPELRGEIISGKVLSKKDKTTVSGKIVSLSISRNNTIYKNVKTNNEGIFYFFLNEDYNAGDLIIKLLDNNRNDFKIVLNDSSFNYLDDLNFSKVYLNENIKNWLLQKSYYNQIENAYFNIKKDSIIKKPIPNNFFGKTGKKFQLDDFTRFPTMRETFIEVVQGAGIRNKNGENKIVLFNPQNSFKNQLSEIEPLILFDGVPFTDHEIIIDYNPYEIEKMIVINNVYFYGPKIYDGILAVFTKNNDLKIPFNSFDFHKKIQSPILEKLFYKPNYSTDKSILKRIPDYRTQLFWTPQFKIESQSTDLVFYTSDVTGIFEINVSGYTENGKKIEIRDYFEVK